MTLYQKINTLLPELTDNDFSIDYGTIKLQNDGNGDYIAEWNHPTLTQPTQEQLDGVTE